MDTPFLRIDLLLPDAAQSVPLCRRMLRFALDELAVPEARAADIELAVSEATGNVVRHAYRSSDGRVGVTVAREDDELTVVVRDEGVGLSDFVSEGDLGYGLRIIERLTSRHVISSAADRGTEVVMVFGLGSADRA